MTQQYITVRTKTGVKIHASQTTSSVCLCGHWLKVNATKRQVFNTQVTCENCLEALSRITTDYTIITQRPSK